MLLYYITRVKDSNIRKILNEATNKYIDNIKQNLKLKKDCNLNIDFNSELDLESEAEFKQHNYGLIVFVSFISFISGFSFGKKSIV
jgi:hypothetical protein